MHGAKRFESILILICNCIENSIREDEERFYLIVTRKLIVTRRLYINDLYEFVIEYKLLVLGFAFMQSN